MINLAPLLSDPWLCGRQSPAERDATMAEGLRAARSARRHELAEQGERTAARINGLADFTARCRGKSEYWIAHPTTNPEIL